MKAEYEYKTGSLQLIHGRGIDFGAHFHLFPEIIYVDAGKINVFVGDGEYSLGAGDAALIFPNTAHAYKTITQQIETRNYIVIFNHTVMGGCEAAFDGYHPVNPVIGGAELHPDAVYAVKALFARDFSAARSDADMRVASAYIQLFLAHTLPRLEMAENCDGTDSSLTASIIEYIYANYRKPLSLDLLATGFGVSKYTLSRLFSGRIRARFNDYVNSIRVERACALLLGSGEKISAVAAECGFENQQTFNRVFKAHTGQTPGEYRKR